MRQIQSRIADLLHFFIEASQRVTSSVSGRHAFFTVPLNGVHNIMSHSAFSASIFQGMPKAVKDQSIPL